MRWKHKAIWVAAIGEQTLDYTFGEGEFLIENISATHDLHESVAVAVSEIWKLPNGTTISTIMGSGYATTKFGFAMKHREIRGPCTIRIYGWFGSAGMLSSRLKYRRTK